jgi:hypothetical protein
MSRWGKPTKNHRRIDPRYHLNETSSKKEVLQEVGYESRANPGATDNIVDRAQDWWQDTAAPAISDKIGTMRDRRAARRGEIGTPPVPEPVTPEVSTSTPATTGTTQSEPWTMNTTSKAQREYNAGMRQSLQPGAYQDVSGWAEETGGEWVAPQSEQPQQSEWTEQQIAQYQATGSPYGPDEGITGAAAEWNRQQDVSRAQRFTDDERTSRIKGLAQRREAAQARQAAYLSGIAAAGGGRTSDWLARAPTEYEASPGPSAGGTLAGLRDVGLSAAAGVIPGVQGIVRAGTPGAAYTGYTTQRDASGAGTEGIGPGTDYGGLATTATQGLTRLATRSNPYGALAGVGSELVQGAGEYLDQFGTELGQQALQQQQRRLTRAGLREQYKQLKGDNNMSRLKTTRKRMVQIIREEAEKLRKKSPELFAEIDQPPDRTGLSAGDWQGVGDPRGSGTDEFPATEAEILGDKIAFAMERAIRSVLSDHLGVHQEQAIHEKHMAEVDEDILNIAMHMRDAALGLIGQPEGVVSLADEDELMDPNLQEQMEAPQKVEITGTEGLEDLVSQLAKGIENLDVSIDYLSAAVTGDNPVEIGIGQRMAGRFHTPSRVSLPQPQGSKEEK